MFDKSPLMVWFRENRDTSLPAYFFTNRDRKIEATSTSTAKMMFGRLAINPSSHPSKVFQKASSEALKSFKVQVWFVQSLNGGSPEMFILA